MSPILRKFADNVILFFKGNCAIVLFTLGLPLIHGAFQGFNREEEVWSPIREGDWANAA
jgi:hypothetical protein